MPVKAASNREGTPTAERDDDADGQDAEPQQDDPLTQDAEMSGLTQQTEDEDQNTATDEEPTTATTTATSPHELRAGVMLRRKFKGCGSRYYLGVITKVIEQEAGGNHYQCQWYDPYNKTHVHTIYKSDKTAREAAQSYERHRRGGDSPPRKRKPRQQPPAQNSDVDVYSVRCFTGAPAGVPKDFKSCHWQWKRGKNSVWKQVSWDKDVAPLLQTKRVEKQLLLDAVSHPGTEVVVNESNGDRDEPQGHRLVYGIRCLAYVPGTAKQDVQWEMQYTPSGEYIRVTWEEVQDQLLPDYKAEVSFAYRKNGKSHRFRDGNRATTTTVNATIEDVPQKARTTTEVRYQHAQGYCAPHSVVNVVPAEIASAPVKVNGVQYKDLAQYLESCCDGNKSATLRQLANALDPVQWRGGKAIQLRKWAGSREVAAIAYHDGALVVSGGRHVVGIRDGLLYDNDPDFPCAIDLRNVPVDCLASLWKEQLQLNTIQEVRKVVVVVAGKGKKRKAPPGGSKSKRRELPHTPTAAQC